MWPFSSHSTSIWRWPSQDTGLENIPNMATLIGWGSLWLPFSARSVPAPWPTHTKYCGQGFRRNREQHRPRRRPKSSHSVGGQRTLGSVWIPQAVHHQTVCLTGPGVQAWSARVSWFWGTKAGGRSIPGSARISSVRSRRRWPPCSHMNISESWSGLSNTMERWRFDSRNPRICLGGFNLGYSDQQWNDIMEPEARPTRSKKLFIHWPLLSHWSTSWYQSTEYKTEADTWREAFLLSYAGGFDCSVCRRYLACEERYLLSLFIVKPACGLHAVYIYLYLIFEYTYTVYHPSLMITEYAIETSGHDITWPTWQPRIKKWKKIFLSINRPHTLHQKQSGTCTQPSIPLFIHYHDELFYILERSRVFKKFWRWPLFTLKILICDEWRDKWCKQCDHLILSG